MQLIERKKVKSVRLVEEKVEKEEKKVEEKEEEKKLGFLEQLKHNLGLQTFSTSLVNWSGSKPQKIPLTDRQMSARLIEK